MAEADFTTELLRGIEALPAGRGYKIPDMPHHLAKQARFTPRKPFDVGWWFAGETFSLELKQVRSGLSWPMADLRGDQEEFLTAVEALGCPGLVVVNFRIALSSRQQKLRGVEVIDRAWGVPITCITRARVIDARTGLDLAWWEENAVELSRFELASVPREQAVCWDPRPLVEWSRRSERRA